MDKKWIIVDENYAFIEKLYNIYIFDNQTNIILKGVNRYEDVRYVISTAYNYVYGVPHIMAQNISTISSGPFSPKQSISSRYSTALTREESSDYRKERYTLKFVRELDPDGKMNRNLYDVENFDYIIMDSPERVAKINSLLF